MTDLLEPDDPLLGRPLPPEVLALDVLRNNLLDGHRVLGWEKVARILPLLGSEIRKHTADIKRVGRGRNKSRKYSPRVGPCHICHRDLPHKTSAQWSVHFKTLRQKVAIRKRWNAIPRDERPAHTLLARQALRRKREKTWLEALHPRIVQTRGPAEALQFWLRLPLQQRRKLLAARKRRLREAHTRA